jgi:signal transduction histidine kinase
MRQGQLVSATTAASAEADSHLAASAPLSLPLTKRLTPRHWVIIDVVVAVLLAAPWGLTVAFGPRLAPGGGGWDGARYIAMALCCLAVPFRRSRPMLALAAITPAAGLLMAIGPPGPMPLVAALVVYVVAATTNRRTSLPAAAVPIVAIVVGSLLAHGGPDWGGVAFLPFVVAAGWLAGENTRARRVYARAVAERAAEREREQVDRALRAAADERVRIARELHDVVAHAMSVIAVRSGVARVVLDSQPDEAREALGIIETTSRRALNEMRLLVGVLRQPEDGADRAPAPGLADLAELIGQITQAGVTVELAQEGETPALPAGLDLSAYRIVQEALTNVVRHAGRAHARLTLRYRSDLVEIEVIDDGGTRTPGRVEVSGSGQGHGIVGMRERVALFGGDLVAAPAGAGFRVLARLPFDRGSQ